MDGQEKVGGRAEGAPRMEQIKDAPYIRQMERYGYCDGCESFWRGDDDDGQYAAPCPALSIGGEHDG